MVFFETVKCIIQILVIALLAIAAIIIHRIGTIRKWEIEKEREAAKQPEFWDDNAI